MAPTLGEIAAGLGARLIGPADLHVARLSHPAEARAGDLAMALSPVYLDALRASPARAAVLGADADLADLGLDAAIVVDRPRYAMAGLTRAIDPGPTLAPGIHSTAIVDPTASIGEGAAIGPFVVIGAGATIGPRARIESHVSVGARTALGADALLLAGSRIGHGVTAGDRLILQPNAVIGGDGFSYVTETPSNVEVARRDLGQYQPAPPQPWHRIHSLGAVTLGHDVEVGANATIDRGTLADTTVGDGTKIDNLVHLGHNVRVGRDCLLCGCTGVAGSAVIGDRVVLAGSVGVSDNIRIGDDVVAAGNTQIYSSVPAGRFVGGSPAVKFETYMEQTKAMRRLPRLARTVADLQKALSMRTPRD